MNDLFDVDEQFKDAINALATVIHIHNCNEWSDKDLWDDKWVDETTTPARKLIVQSLRLIVKAHNLYKPDIIEAWSNID